MTADPLPPDAPGPPPSSEMRAPEPPPTAVLPAAPPEPARERRALAALAIVAVAAIVWIIHPVGIGILLGTLNAFTVQPLYEWMRARGRRPAVAAAIAVGLSSIVIVAVLAGISSLLVGRGVVLAESLIAALSPGAPARGLVVQSVSGDATGLPLVLPVRTGRLPVVRTLQVRLGVVCSALLGADLLRPFEELSAIVEDEDRSQITSVAVLALDPDLELRQLAGRTCSSG